MQEKEKLWFPLCPMEQCQPMELAPVQSNTVFMGKNLGRERQQFTLWYRRRPQCCSHLRRLVSGLFKHALGRASVLCPLLAVLCRSGLKHADPCGSQEIFAINAEKSKLNLPGKPSIKGSAPLSVPEWRGLDQLAQTKGSALLPSGIAKLPGHVAHKLKPRPCLQDE